MTAIEVKGLSFSYAKGAPVLNDVSFSVERGEYVCLLGPNGAGKSTLFCCMLGTAGKYGGEILIDGESIRTLSEKKLARKVAYIPQSSMQTFNYSVEDAVLMGTTALTGAFSSPSEKERALADAALDRLGILHLKGRKYLNISGGERQLVLVARALAQQAKILFMDEPTANLDYGNRCRVLDEVRALTGDGYTIVQSTHDPDQAFLYADKVLALSGGHIAACGAPNEVLTEELMTKLYGVDIAVADIGGSARVCVPRSTLKGKS